MARPWTSHPLERGFAPTWASAWGQDRHGVFVEFEVGKATQRMRWIMPGRFRMGSPDSDSEAFDNEKPAHDVIIRHGFWMFETPCCQDLWEEVMGENANPSRSKGPRRPVESVSWDDAVSFLAKLNAMIPGLWLRLPREAEWEYACRAGSSELRYGPLDDVAWYEKNSKGETQPVAQKGTNAWGLFDMLGNVWEWCDDGRRTYTPKQEIDPNGGRGAERVVRGGSWAVTARYARAASRNAYHPGYRYDNLGFRPLSSGIGEREIGDGVSGANEASRASAKN